MAVRDHTLDDKIIDAARAEFLTHGFKEASLHKIAARAEVTTGALYTRYKNKDALFRSLLEGVFDGYSEHLSSVAGKYMDAMSNPSAEAFIEAMDYESLLYLDFLFDHKDECVLMFCRSDGSSVGEEIAAAISQKTKTTVAFFENISDKKLDPYVVETLMNMQLHAYRQILNSPMDKEEATECLKSIFHFMNIGWKDLYSEFLD